MDNIPNVTVVKAWTIKDGVSVAYPYSEVYLDCINPATVGLAVTAFLTKCGNIQQLTDKENCCLQVYLMYLDADDDSGSIGIELSTL